MSRKVTNFLFVFVHEWNYRTHAIFIFRIIYPQKIAKSANWGKCQSGEVSVRGSVTWGKCHLGDVPVWELTQKKYKRFFTGGHGLILWNVRHRILVITFFLLFDTHQSRPYFINLSWSKISLTSVKKKESDRHGLGG